MRYILKRIISGVHKHDKLRLFAQNSNIGDLDISVSDSSRCGGCGWEGQTVNRSRGWELVVENVREVIGGVDPLPENEYSLELFSICKNRSETF